MTVSVGIAALTFKTCKHFGSQVVPSNTGKVSGFARIADIFTMSALVFNRSQSQLHRALVVAERII